jgi:hypothetical protein
MVHDHECMSRRTCNLLAIVALLLVVMAGQAYWRESAGIAAAQTIDVAAQHDGQHDFDFYVGKWQVHNRRLLHPLTGSNEWVEFDGTSVARKIWDGRGNMDEYQADGPSGHIEGVTVRLYNNQAHQWSLYWANSKNGEFSMPATVGHFTNQRGEFFDHEVIGGKPVMVRFLWDKLSPKRCRWEQAFSTDEGKTWETNWTMDSTRVDGVAL